jgi:hypothetical protein
MARPKPVQTGRIGTEGDFCQMTVICWIGWSPS